MYMDAELSVGAADDARSLSGICDQPSCSSSLSSSGSLEPLEELTTCPIHLGRLHDPKLLHCSHVFCLACLEKWDSQQPNRDRFPCPLCRVEARLPVGGLRCLPSASAHQSIINYIVDRQCRRMQLPSAATVKTGNEEDASVASSVDSPRGRSSSCMHSSGSGGGGGGGGGRKRSLERKQEILTHLAEDFVRRSEPSMRRAGLGGGGIGGGQTLMREFDKAELLAVRENLNKLITRLDDEESRSQKLQDAVEAAAAGSRQRQYVAPAAAASPHYPTVNAPDATVDSDLDDIRGGSDGGGGGGGGSDSSEAEDALDLSFIRHNMKRNSSYKLKEIDTAAWAELLQSTNGELEIGAAGLLAESDSSAEQPDVLLLNNCSRSLLVYSSQDGQLKDLPVLVGDAGSTPSARLLCHHMRLLNGLVYVSGVTQLRSSTDPAAASSWLSVVACLQLDGQVVKRIERPGGSSDEPLFAGFFVDSRRGDLVVAQPSDQKVEFFTPCLSRTGHWFTFENLHPQYVTWTRERKMLWVSCPREGHILIVNDRTGVYRKLTTTQIFDSVPAHIITTSDKRIIFTDNQRQRLFWVIRRSEFIFVQRLQFLQELDEITGIAALGDDKILVCTKRRICVLKPVRKLRHGRRSKCLIV